MPQEHYSAAARFMHRTALGSAAVAETSLDIDRMIFPVRAADVADQKHVFICGLARAGTTILMRQFWATGAFRSLTYRDMPFVLAPNLWARISSRSRRQMAAGERAHGDGILVDFDSPEAFEEVFWRVTAGTRYIRPDRLVPMGTTEEMRNSFRTYVASLLRAHPGQRYLSKNNNNILRLPGLTAAFPQALVIIPFRAPLSHAVSLSRQHQTFVARHGEDPFARRYMDWLGHHEFGQGHRPFVFDADSPPTATWGDPLAGPEYWLHLWCETYSYLLKTAPESCVFLSYERLCNSTETVWPQICALADLPGGTPAEPLREARHETPCDVPTALRDRAEAICDALRARETRG